MTESASTLASTLARPSYALADTLWADTGAVFITGTHYCPVKS